MKMRLAALGGVFAGLVLWTFAAVKLRPEPSTFDAFTMYRSVMLLPEAYAARNGSGTYSLFTPGNPVISGTIINSATFNSTMSDIASEVTNSLDRNGRGAMLAQLQLFSGTVGTPGLGFANETNSGLYRNASNDIRFAVAGVDVQKWNAGTSAFLVPALLSAGAVGAPSIAFSAETNTGVYRAGAGDIRFAIGGADSLRMNATGFGIGGAPAKALHVQSGSSGATPAANVIGLFEANGINFVQLLAPNANHTGILFGDVANTSRGYIQYNNSADTSPDTMNFGVSGSTRASFSASGFSVDTVQPFTSATTLTVKGNRTGSDAGTDILFNSAGTRSAGLLFDIQNNGTSKWNIGGSSSVVTGTTAWTTSSTMTASEFATTNGGITFSAVIFNNLATPANGRMYYCSDCTVANPCASGGTGAIAKRLNGVWVCN